MLQRVLQFWYIYYVYVYKNTRSNNYKLNEIEIYSLFTNYIIIFRLLLIYQNICHS